MRKNTRERKKKVPFRGEIVGAIDHVVSVLDQVGQFAAAGRTQYFLQCFQRLLQHIGRTHVNFGDHDEHGYVECQREAQMLLGHAYDAHVGADHQHGVVGTVAGHAEHGRLQVAFVASQVNERDHFGRLLANILPVETFADSGADGLFQLVYFDAFCIEAEYVVAHAARSARLDLVLVPEQFSSGFASSIIF